MGAVIASPHIGLVHGFLTGPQSDRADFDEVGGPMPTALLKQVHSATAVLVTRPHSENARPEADAMVTATPGLRLGIVTADCAPVLLADETAGVIGAAHAGWRGARSGIIESTMARMVELGAKPQTTVAVIGPAIAQASYEVDAGFRELFDENESQFFVAGRPDHFQFDLPGYVAWRLAGAGVRTIDGLGLDTYADQARFHSFRRATHRGQATGGRQLSLIALGV